MGTFFSGSYRGRFYLLTALLVAGFAAPAQAEPYVLAVMGDSISSNNGSSSGQYPNWVTQIQTLAQVSIPAAYDLAQDGATAANLASQYPTIVSLASTNQINASVLTVGGNDAGDAAIAFYESGYNLSTLTSALNTSVSEIEQTIAAVAATGIPQVIANIPDIALTPLAQQYFSEYHVPASEVAVAQTYIQAANAQIEAYALSKGDPVLDLYAVGQQVLTQPSLTLAGVTFSPSSFYSPDGFDPSSVDDGILANMVVYALDNAFGAKLSQLSEQQIVENIGDQPLVAGSTYFDVSPFVILPSSVPEPESAVLLTCGVLVLLASERRRRRRHNHSSRSPV